MTDLRPYTEEQFRTFRASHVTATDVAQAANGTYGGLYAVVASKLGKLPPKEQTDAMTRGHRWQPVIADAVHVLTGWFVVGEETLCEHPEHRWQSCTVDGFLAREPEVSIDDVEAVGEVKTYGRHVTPPRATWRDQVQWQAHVTGLSRGLLVAARIDDDTDELLALDMEWIEADPDRQASLIEVAERIRMHMEMASLPDPDGPDCLPLVKRLTADADPDAEVVDLTDLADVVARFEEIKAAEKAVKAERDTIEAQLRAALGEATRGDCDGYTVSVSKPALVITDEAEAEILAARPDLGRLVLDRDRAKAEAPELVELARRPVGARRLTVRTKKEGTR